MISTCSSASAWRKIRGGGPADTGIRNLFFTIKRLADEARQRLHAFCQRLTSFCGRQTKCAGTKDSPAGQGGRIRISATHCNSLQIKEGMARSLGWGDGMGSVVFDYYFRLFFLDMEDRLNMHHEFAAFGFLRRNLDASALSSGAA
jgi:hypothetical protein